MQTRRLGRTDLVVAPLVLGTNVAGWTADEKTSCAVFDAFVAEGFTAFDTADAYAKGESEAIIGRWLKARKNRDKVLVFTKVGSDPEGGRKNLSAAWIEQRVEASLTRLQTDYIDLYQSHWPDPTVRQEETLGAYDRLIKAGKVRYIGASNYDAALLSESLAAAKTAGLPRYETVQNEFNLYSRDQYEGSVQDLVVSEGLSVLSYYSLAAGFLTGKYRTVADLGKGARGKRVETYFNERGRRILAALDAVSKRLNLGYAEIALAWINAQPGIGAPIASATSVGQLASLARSARLTLSDADVQHLTDAGR